MADRHPFGASNQPDTCLWCGRKLRRNRHEETRVETVEYQHMGYGTREDGTWGQVPDGPPVPSARHIPTGRTLVAEHAGSYEDGVFCGLRCGYQFGRAMATNGRRLQPPRPKPCALCGEEDGEHNAEMHAQEGAW